ncbi:MAG: hypothetical protein ACHQ5A_10865, partial [Opitutales bacterium]
IVFAGGLQVADGASRRVLARFFDAREREVHRRLLAKRQLGPDQPPGFYRTFPLDLPGELRTRYAGKTATVRVRVGRNGTVDDVFLEGTGDPELEPLLQAQLSHWLLLPRIRQGQPVPETIRLPLQFD